MKASNRMAPTAISHSGDIKASELVWSKSLMAWLAFSPSHIPKEFDRLPAPEDIAIPALCAHLLNLHGDMVCVMFEDTWSLAILKGGSLTSADGIQRCRGQINNCHENVFKVWQRNPQKYRIQTGYALTGGVWRRHSWLLDEKDRVHETTEVGEKYFGLILDQWALSGLLNR